jgi:PST family polysaccharide transporter
VVQLGAQPIKVALFAISGMALARLLTPTDFGIYVMAMTWIALVASIQDFGFPLAVLHGESLDDEQLSGLFWTNLRLSLGLFAASVVMAPLLAWFYGESAVAPVTLGLGLALLAAALGWQHRSLLARQLRFHTIAAVEVTAVTLSVGISIGAALAGAGYWALVIQFFVQGVVRTVGVWIGARWRPLRRSSLGTDRTRLRPFLHYGWQYSVTRLIRHVGHNLDRILVAALGGARPAGLYDNAYRWAHYPVLHVIHPLLSVAVSSFSRTRFSAARYVAGVQDATLPLLSGVLPMLAFVALEAEPVILVLLGDQWVESIPLFRLLALAAFARSLGMPTRWLYLSEGRTAQQLKWTLLESVGLIVAVSVGVVRGGAFGVAVAFTTATWILAGPGIGYCLMGSPMGGRDYLAAIWRPVLATTVAIAFLAVVREPLVGTNVLFTLALRLAAFGVAYLLTWLALPGRRRAVGRVLRLVGDLRE